MTQSLDYLIFDYSEDDEGNGTWDAMASVPAGRLGALAGEVEAILQWAGRAFPGRRGAIEDGGDWDFDLHAQDDAGEALSARYDEHAARMQVHAARTGHTTITLTVSGSAAFAEAFREAFCIEGD
ncbi:hypothetical protein [Diaphorobacter aerolatus]|uniref:Uncharacterized protein n=1 Tax=Diaphorobacter aerolatus TaxID=1288495 RepID=A0A7H0GIJ9_9BURK|nr:hypothetical protein [Diaphorobacter aerolatus]QNP48115.1 hypothetical protein H9K75_18975 [Diaphorobacter aerolatus]